MSKPTEEKFYDIRTQQRYVKDGTVSQKDLTDHLKALPNDEDNFDLVMFESDEIGVGAEFSEDEIKSMPNLNESDIDKFEFDDEED